MKGECPVCRGELKKHVIQHHYWHPRSRYPKEHRKIWVHEFCEKRYHEYWQKHCDKGCVDAFCEFKHICCYHSMRSLKKDIRRG
jgi:hypothetical protein